jgi:hypothetical protein
VALLQLDRVTQTLLNLLREGISSSPGWAGTPPTASALPPDRLTGNQTIGLYLFHVSEDPAVKNKVWPGRPLSPVRFSPMGLDLHYILSSHSDLVGDAGAFREQRIIGLAMKVLHDIPVVDDATTVNGVVIMDAAIANGENRLRLELRAIPPEQAVSYWTAGSQSLRLSSYYSAHVVLLEPDEPTVSTGPVLAYNVIAVVTGPPRLEESRGTLSFTLPGESTARTVESRPASVAYGDPFTLTGVNLATDRTVLLVRSPGWAGAVEADPAWSVAATGDSVAAVAQAVVGPAATPVLPGTYDALVRTTVRTTLADGSVKDIDRTSNAIPFVVRPLVTAVGPVAVTGDFTVNGQGFAPAAAAQMFVGNAELTRRNVGPPAPGEFVVTGPGVLSVRLPAGLPAGKPVRVRILVNGAESAPIWVTP